MSDDNVLGVGDLDGAAAAPRAQESKLTRSAPARGSALPDLLSWVNQAMHHQHDPLVAVKRYGTTLNARIELHFASGATLAVKQRDLMGANGLRHVLLSHDGTSMPSSYKRADLDLIVARIVWAADTEAGDDELDALVGDVEGFLKRSLYAISDKPQVIVRNYRVNGYGAIADFDTQNTNRDGTRETMPPYLLFDHEAGVLWVGRSHLASYLRDQRARHGDPSELRGKLESLGWQHADLHLRRQGGDWRNARKKARVWMVPVPWEHAETPLHDVLSKLPKPPEDGS